MQEKQIRSKNTQNEQQFEPGSLQEQDNMLISMLSSDKIVDIAIFVCTLGVCILAYCCYLVEGHLRFHLGFILFLMFGLGVSLVIYKLLSLGGEQSNGQNEGQNQSEQTQSSEKSESENMQNEKNQRSEEEGQHQTKKSEKIQ